MRKNILYKILIVHWSDDKVVVAVYASPLILSTAVADAKSSGSAEKRGESRGGCVRRRGRRGGHPVEQELAFF